MLFSDYLLISHMTRSIVLLIVWFWLLIKWADFLVDGASNVAKKFHVSEIVIGLTIVAFGTSAPELAVNITSSLQGTGDLAIGNILGSNIANILLILWIASIVRPLTIQSSTKRIEIPFMILAIVIFGLLVLSPFAHEASYMLKRTYATILLCMFGIFIYYLFHTSKASPGAKTDWSPAQNIRISVAYIAGGLAGLVIGWQRIVDWAVSIATYYGISERIIWLTVLAIGTSLPELVTSVVAWIKWKSDIAVGNIVWSNIFNILFVLGITGLIRPIPFSNHSAIDLYVSIASSLMLLLIVHINNKNVIQKYHGVFFVVCYVAYIFYLIYQ